MKKEIIIFQKKKPNKYIHLYISTKELKGGLNFLDKKQTI